MAVVALIVAHWLSNWFFCPQRLFWRKKWIYIKEKHLRETHYASDVNDEKRTMTCIRSLSNGLIW